MLTSANELKLAVELLQKGASDYILKDDVFFDNLKRTIEKILSFKKLQNEKQFFQEKADSYKKRFLFAFVVMIAVVAGIVVWYVLK